MFWNMTKAFYNQTFSSVTPFSLLVSCSAIQQAIESVSESDDYKFAPVVSTTN